MSEFKLTCDNIVFSNGANNSGALVDAVDFTDSLGEYYLLNEGDGVLILGDNGGTGTITNPTWILINSIRRGFMAMGMALGIPFIRGNSNGGSSPTPSPSTNIIHEGDNVIHEGDNVIQ